MSFKKLIQNLQETEVYVDLFDVNKNALEKEMGETAFFKLGWEGSVAIVKKPINKVFFNAVNKLKLKHEVL